MKKNIIHTVKLNPLDAVAYDVAPARVIARLGTDDGFGYFKRDPLSKEAGVKFVYGPMAEKLYAYEQLGYSPEELKEIVDAYNSINIISNTLANICRFEEEEAEKERAERLSKLREKRTKECENNKYVPLYPTMFKAIVYGCTCNCPLNNKRVPYKYNKNRCGVVSTKE